MAALGFAFDAWWTQWRAPTPGEVKTWPSDTRFVGTNIGKLRVRQWHASRQAKPTLPLLIVPDGPNVIEHYELMAQRLTEDSIASVAVVDFAGFGHSTMSAEFDFALDQGGQALIQVLDACGFEKAVLACPCSGGFYGLAAANCAPARVAGLILPQTPTMVDMEAWAYRVVPWYIRTPCLGQIIMACLASRVAHGWYGVALPKGSDKSVATSRYVQPAMQVLSREHGCFCLASLTQGLQLETGRSGGSLLVDQRQRSNLSLALPIVVMCGQADRTHRRTDWRRIKQLLPQAQLIELPACGHFPDLEAPEIFVTAVQELCAQK